MYSGEQKKRILYNLPLRQAKSIAVAMITPFRTLRRARPVLRSLPTVGVRGREKVGSGRRKHIWP